MKIIGYIYTDFPEKFGIPRQSGLIEELKGRIAFEPEYSSKEAVRGLEEFSHIWLLWKFHKSKRHNDSWAATVTPPRLGGKKRVGVFATRSPFRPNDIGLSCVRLDGIEYDNETGAPTLLISGVDMVDGTPIYDIKPYISFTDCHPEATKGYTEVTYEHSLEVDFPEHLLSILPLEKRNAAIKVLEQDPRPAYNAGEDSIYGISFAGFDIRFRVKESLLTVLAVVLPEELSEKPNAKKMHESVSSQDAT